MKTAKISLGYKQSLVIFGTAALLLFLVTHAGIDILYNASGVRKILLWFINGGLFVFAPMLFLAILFAKKQTGSDNLKQALTFLRLKPLNAKEIIASIVGLITVFILSGALAFVLPKIIPNFNPQPPFLTMNPLASNEYWILLCWLPMFFFNIFGEELFWRGLLMPLQENAIGKHTWWFHGLCWLVFHIPFGWNMILLLLPVFFIQSFLVWKYKNTWIGIIIHGIYNGSGFLLVAFGLI
jgi:membrane protease YdiL (CAAX protease family)